MNKSLGIVVVQVVVEAPSLAIFRGLNTPWVFAYEPL